MSGAEGARRVAARPLFLVAVRAAAALAGAAAIAVAPRQASAQDPTYTSLFPAEAHIARCDELDTTVEIWNAVDLAAFQLEIAFNPAALEFESATLGDFLTSTGRSVIVPAPAVGNGNVLFAAASEPGPPGPSGDGVLAVMRFRATAVGTSPLDLHDVILINSVGASTMVTSSDAVVIVGGTSSGPCAPTPTPSQTPTPSASTTASRTPSPTGTPQMTPSPNRTVSPTRTEAVTPPTPSTETATPSATASASPLSTPVTGTPAETTPTGGPSGNKLYLPQALGHERGALLMVESGRAADQTAAVVRIVPQAQSKHWRDRVDATVWVEDPVSLAAFQFTLRYDRRVLALDTVELGPLLGSTGREPIELPIQTAPDRFTYGAVSTPGGPGVSRSGALAMVHFIARGGGTSPLDLTDARLANEVNESQEVTLEDGLVRVAGISFLPFAETRRP